jgi:hypothetical protein
MNIKNDLVAFYYFSNPSAPLVPLSITFARWEPLSCFSTSTASWALQSKIFSMDRISGRQYPGIGKNEA